MKIDVTKHLLSRYESRENRISRRQKKLDMISWLEENVGPIHEARYTDSGAYQAAIGEGWELGCTVRRYAADGWYVKIKNKMLATAFILKFL